MNAAELKTDPWKILIVDDEPEIHTLTKTVLKSVEFEDRPIEFLSAYDAPQTKAIMSVHDDIALILMDVIMEEDDSGLKLIRYIREELQNHKTRIILRTAHPGEAPERRIIIEYEINDYKEKEDLTSNRLFTSVIKSLRNYRDLQQIDLINQDLEWSQECLTRVIESSSVLFEVRTLEDFYDELLHQTLLIMGPGAELMIVDIESTEVLRATLGKKDLEKTLLSRKDLTSLTDSGTPESRNSIENDRIICRFSQAGNNGPVLIAETDRGNKEQILGLLDIFIGNAVIVYDNLILEEESQETQTELIDLLGDVVEERDYNGGEIVRHINRVTDFVIYLARKLDYSDEDIAILRNAVALHDIGKIGISDEILKKPGKLTDKEFSQVKDHALFGYEILRTSDRKLFRIASIIAWQHHERWDGQGYPQGLAGEEIHELGRMTCIADVFDALSSDRIYRKAWSLEKTMDYIKDGRGSQFDPNLADLFLEDPDAIHEIVARHKEHPETIQEIRNIKNA